MSSTTDAPASPRRHARPGAGRPTAAIPRAPGARRERRLADLTPLDQLTAGRLARRVPQLMVGLTCYGVAVGLFVRAQVGLDPWGVFHLGVSRQTGLGMGTVTVIASFLVLVLWVPLRQWPGLGTVANSLWIGVALAATMAALDPVTGAVAQCVAFAAGLVLNGVGGAMYIGSQLGPGPRDGLMTGLHHRTGVSLRLIRTGIEVSVLALGWLLGGDVGAGTVVFAVTIGPLVQFFLPYFIVDLGPGVADAGADDGDTQAEMR